MGQIKLQNSEIKTLKNEDDFTGAEHEQGKEFFQIVSFELSADISILNMTTSRLVTKEKLLDPLSNSP